MNHTRIQTIAAFLLVGLLSAIGGCSSSSSYVDGFRYAPEPALVDVFRRGSNTQAQSPPLSVMVSIIGVRRADAKAGLPASVEVRLRMEANGPAHVTFDPHTLELVTGSLQPFGAPITQPPTSISLNPGQTQNVSAFFPFPPGTSYRTLILDTLRLRWLVQIDNQTVPQTAYFERASPLYYETSDSFD